MTALLARMGPLLNKMIPAGLAIRGLSKINPKIGSFIQNSLAAGYSTDLVLDYLRKRTSEDYHNEAGRTLRPDEVGSMQNYNPEENKKTLSAAIGLGAGALGLMGGGQQQEPQMQQAATDEQAQIPPPQEQQRQQALQQFNQQRKQKQNVGDQEAQRFQQYYGQQGQQGQNQSDQALLSALNKILTM